MVKISQTQAQIHCQNEYGTLQKVVLCEPQYMEIKEVINDVQKKYKHDNIDRSLAISQHQLFEQTLRNAGVEVIKLKPSKNHPEQVFTRDIGFTLGNRFFISKMANPIREGEEEILAQWMNEQGLSYMEFSNHSIEGGDVIIDGNHVFIGISERTCMKAVEALQKILPEFEIFPIPFNSKYLHLDCVFNILSSEDALIYPDALDPEIVDHLASMYHLIEVSEKEQFSMGTNVLSIGQNRVFSLPINQDVNDELRKHGYKVVEVDFSEIIKSGGSFRCCSMPLLRH
ncbi:dimethylarginine dimethylaminohydrolase family protein [Psychrobacillus sp. NEAU-3TGS]|uniref:dimethylarginine dimethylaminohydrolase family protein n=1 Tax=Psychrobacillus sp. NEAU-3TGS TaxID=2995412 RepID=UPI002498C182|nr:dimethylarginine dimethylaminohydrolase family protein [Psychrobacillus sp. NEAU-3TGS]MDI2589176.1 dimethylarginine dimethylaminohydrolase family protein [Psychrobacillus sp. NEAU-3TGS]